MSTYTTICETQATIGWGRYMICMHLLITDRRQGFTALLEGVQPGGFALLLEANVLYLISLATAGHQGTVCKASFQVLCAVHGCFNATALTYNNKPCITRWCDQHEAACGKSTRLHCLLAFLST